MKMRNGLLALILALLLPLPLLAAQAGEGGRLFVHLKTGLKHDDAQICVAYNMIWAALKQGLAVDVLVDADGVNTFKTGWFSDEDSIQEYKIPENLRTAIAGQLNVPLDDVPKTYGDYFTITAASRTGFTIRFFDATDTGVQRTFDYVAKGYGGEG